MARLREADIAPARDEILASFVSQYSWIPQWEAEVTLADEGLESRLLEVEQYAGGAAVRSELATAHGYRIEAHSDSLALARALTGENIFQPVKVKVLKEDEV